jgi:hypothetical protein
LVRPAQFGLAVVAKVGKGNAIKRHRLPRRLAFRVNLATLEHREITDTEMW